jgi:competence protein ComEA
MGEVENEGIVEINEGSRVSDAINAAGGLKETADISNINLAFVLEDGMKIIIPSKEDKTVNINSNTENIITGGGENIISGSSSKKENSLININTATQEELETLPGIGSAIALRIITYREENGKFSSIEDIKKVSGIGDSKFSNIKDLICVQ